MHIQSKAISVVSSLAWKPLQTMGVLETTKTFLNMNSLHPCPSKHSSTSSQAAVRRSWPVVFQINSPHIDSPKPL